MSEITLSVTGMTCPSCVRHVDRALREVEGVEDVKVRFFSRTVVVRRQPSTADDALLEAVRSAGYEAALAA